MLHAVLQARIACTHSPRQAATRLLRLRYGPPGDTGFPLRLRRQLWPAGWPRPAREEHGTADELTRGDAGLVADEVELGRRDARRRGLDDEAARDRAVLQIRPGVVDFF